MAASSLADDNYPGANKSVNTGTIDNSSSKRIYKKYFGNWNNHPNQQISIR